MEQRELNKNRSKWGRVRFGDGQLSAMSVAVPVGVVLAILIGVLAAWTGVAGPQPLLGGAIFAIVMSATFVALAWVLVVDRDTLQGAADRPEESVENTWVQTASSGAFYDLIVISGIATAVLTFSDWDLSGQIAFIAVIALGWASFSLRYLLASRRG